MSSLRGERYSARPAERLPETREHYQAVESFDEASADESAGTVALASRQAEAVELADQHGQFGRIEESGDLVRVRPARYLATCHRSYPFGGRAPGSANCAGALSLRFAGLILVLASDGIPLGGGRARRANSPHFNRRAGGATRRFSWAGGSTRTAQLRLTWDSRRRFEKIECGRRDSNPQDGTPSGDPKSPAFASFATPALNRLEGLSCLSHAGAACSATRCTWLTRRRKGCGQRPWACQTPRSCRAFRTPVHTATVDETVGGCENLRDKSPGVQHLWTATVDNTPQPRGERGDMSVSVPRDGRGAVRPQLSQQPSRDAITVAAKTALFRYSAPSVSPNPHVSARVRDELLGHSVKVRTQPALHVVKED